MNELTRAYSDSMSGRSPRPAPPVEEISYYYSDQGDETHLRHYSKILLKRIRPMAAVFIDVMIIGVIITLASPTLYTARSTLKIEPQNPTVTGVAGVAEGLPGQFDIGPYDYYQTQFALLKSEPLRARVIKNLNLENNPAFTGQSKGPSLLGSFSKWIGSGFGYMVDAISRLTGEEKPAPSVRAPFELGVNPGLIGRYSRYLTVEPVRNTRLVDIVFDTPDAKLSQDLANAHAASFIQMILENRFSLTKEAKDFLGARLAELRDKVQKAEEKLNRFRQQHGVVSFEKGENIVVDRLVDLNRVLTKVKAERIEAESLYHMTRNKNTDHLSQVLSNPLIQQIKGRLATLEAEKGRLLSIFTVEHPRIQELNQQLIEARRGLRGEINNIVRGIESNYSAARAREASLEKEAQTQQATALSLKQVGVEYAVLNEEVIVNRGLYENVLKRLHETNVANDLAASNMQIVQRAELPFLPSSPNWQRNLLLSAILGLLLAAGVAFFLEYMDATVNTPQGVWAAVSLTTLGVVPHLKSLPGKCRPGLLQRAPVKNAPSADSNGALSKELVMARDQLSLTAESYRTIRTALLLSKAEHPPKVILLTSPAPGEGKTVTAVNLGMALAQSGQTVLVLDADLRKGRCHKLVNVPNKNGLANVLTGQVALRSAITETAVGNFYILPRGVLPPNPADLLMSHKMQQIVNELRNSFDFVLIDSPPAIAVSDAAVISSLCDGVLMVFHGQKTTVQAARRAVERLDSINATLLGVILNGVDIRNPDYVDYRSYYPTYYASMQEELRNGRERPVEDWASRARDDDFISDVDELDRVMDDLGFHRGKKDGAGHEGNGSKSVRGVVPRQFFDRMAARLSEAVGPTASATVANQVTALRESMDAFPMSRIWELAQRVSQDIVDAPRKERFLRAMSQEIRALPSR